MKFFNIILIILFSYQVSIGQKILFKPIFIDQCTNLCDSSILWYLSDDSIYYGLDTNNLMSVELPQLGEYKLKVIDKGAEGIAIMIKDFGVNVDTFLLPRLVYDYNTFPPRGYFDCKSLANGKITDCYLNGNKRIEGTFQNGRPIDSLSIYYQNGQLLNLYIPNKFSIDYCYYNNGHIKSISNGKKRYKKEYYKDGQLRRIHHWTRKYKSSIMEFYQNGNIKLIQTNRNIKHYFPNGNLSNKITRRNTQHFNRKSGKKLYGKGWKRIYSKCNYKWEIYDSLGFLSKKVFFHKYGDLSEIFPDSLQQIPDHFIDKEIFYINGVKIKK